VSVAALRLVLSVTAALTLTVLSGCLSFISSDDATNETHSDAGVDATSDAAPCKATCASKKAECGTIPDGCGSTLECGICAAGTFCGGGGPNKCGTTPCLPKECAALSAECGLASDGCQGVIDCGKCAAPAMCNPANNVCNCFPGTCSTLGYQCGTAPDGCGGTVTCGACKSDSFCGGAGPNKCGKEPCTPTTCAAAGQTCGTISDGCGSTLDCGSCAPPATCGGGGIANQCGCTPSSCAALGKNCGAVADGCDGVLDCGSCAPPLVCGAGGTPGVCGTHCPAATIPVLGPAGVFCIDETEVKRSKYDVFLASNPSTAGQPPECDFNVDFQPAYVSTASQPVRGVDWCDARAYCLWAGKRLCGRLGGGSVPFTESHDPTVSEWMYACSGGGSMAYPYGGAYSPTACNGLDANKGGPTDVGTPTCVGSFAGLYDMSGNVAEWEDACSGLACRVRGGTYDLEAANLTCVDSMTRNLDAGYPDVGFRCCRD